MRCCLLSVRLACCITAILGPCLDAGHTMWRCQAVSLLDRLPTLLQACHRHVLPLIRGHDCCLAVQVTT